MITIKPMLTEQKESYRKGYIVDGHANFAEYGHDIVCSAVSAITQTALAGLMHYNEVKYSMKSGRLTVLIENDDHTTDAIIKTMLLGLRLIQEQNKDYVKIKETGETM
jgi:uncharacterized protein